ncbi:MAG: Hpt domain-containing protein [Cytophaga sp.]|nr:Hpt domain-containing protein [Undibacterium sp.]
MLEFFIMTISPLFDKISMAINQLRFSEIITVGHQIKGACLNLGVTKLATVAAQIEQSGKDADIVLAKQLLSSANDAFVRLKNYVQHERTSL